MIILNTCISEYTYRNIFIMEKTPNLADDSIDTVSLDDQSSNLLLNLPPQFGSGQMGNFALPGSNQTQDIIAEESLFDNAISHHVGAHPVSSPGAGNNAAAVFNIKTPLAPIQQNSGQQSKTTIPPHLIPLGPDGLPLLNSDGTPVIRNGSPSLILGSNNQQQLSEIFPFLKPENQHLHQLAYTPPTNNTEVDNRDFLSRAINVIHDLPMDTRRRVLAGMMMGLPMTALTLATLGAPTMAIAPMALAIPGFLMAGFTETNPNRSRHGGHGHGGHHHGAAHGRHGAHGAHGGSHGGVTSDGVHFGISRRRGLAGLIDAARQFQRAHNTAHSSHLAEASARTQEPNTNDSNNVSSPGGPIAALASRQAGNQRRGPSGGPIATLASRDNHHHQHGHGTQHLFG